MQKFSKKSSLVLTLCILSAISSSGYAAEKDSLHQYNLDEYVVTATRTALTQKEVPQSVEVITKADIQNVGAISVRDVLKQQPICTLMTAAAVMEISSPSAAVLPTIFLSWSTAGASPVKISIPTARATPVSSTA